ncbi:MAG: hypothetical protein JWP46_1595 [Modestobacter sp.]|jgi:hypothetical protein|nr:hypothetical protein [Modestobacter sp.]
MTPPASVRSQAALRPVVLTQRRPRAEAEDWTGRWVCVGFADQLACAGDVLPATVSGHAVHVRRAGDGTLAAAFNARPFGGCMSIPVQCAGARKIRCPHQACAFSEDPGVLGDDNDPDRTARRQFVGADPNRLVPVPLARWGPLLFVHVATVPAPPLEAVLTPLRAGPGAPVPEDLRATAVAEQELPLGWRTGARAVVATLATRCGAGTLREEEADGVSTLTAPAGASQLSCHLVWPHLVLARLPGRLLAALFRPVGPDRSSVLSAVLRPAGSRTGEGAGDRDAEFWREVLAAAARD